MEKSFEIIYMNYIGPSVEGGTEKLFCHLCLLEFDLVIFQKSQMTECVIICAIYEWVDVDILFLLISMLLYMFLKYLWIYTVLCSSAIWDYR